MEYTKPQIIGISDASKAVQSQDIPKGQTMTLDHTSEVFASNPAYEADE